MKRRAVFLDRDGVLNEVIMREGKPSSPRGMEEFKIRPGAAKAVAEIERMGLMRIVVTNQPDVARGHLPQELMQRMHSVLKESMPIDEILYCPHDDADRCDCRKPEQGMFLKAAADWEIDLAGSFLIADGIRDVEAGREAGCTTILLNAPYNRGVDADRRAADIGEAVKIIKTMVGGG